MASDLLRQDPEVLLFPLLRSGFSQKLRVLHAYTLLFPKPIDMEASPVRNALLLMDKRNKFVHSELSEHVQLDDVYFDGLFPLYGGGTKGQLGANVERAYLTPGKPAVLEAAETASAFAKYILSCVAPTVVRQVELLLNQPQIGFNTRARIYSVPYPASAFQYYMSPGKASETTAPNSAAVSVPANAAAEEPAEARSTQDGPGTREP